MVAGHPHVIPYRSGRLASVVTVNSSMFQASGNALPTHLQEVPLKRSEGERNGRPRLRQKGVGDPGKFVAESPFMNSGMVWTVAHQVTSSSCACVASRAGRVQGCGLLLSGVGWPKNGIARGSSIRVPITLGIGPKVRHNMSVNTDALRRPPAARAPRASRRLPSRYTAG